MIVVDTNVISYLFIPGPNTQNARTLLLKDSEWISAILWKSEFRNVLALYLRRGHFALRKTLTLMHEAENLMRGNEYEVSSDKVMRLAAQSHCSAYDCEFVALAQDLGLPLITSDKMILKEFTDTAVSLQDHERLI